MANERVKNVVKVEIDGTPFSSRMEGYYYTLLKDQVKNGEIKSFKMQVSYELQPQFRKCSRHGCGFVWEKPVEDPVNEKRYSDVRECPHCGSLLMLVREMTYISDFDIIDNSGAVHVVDVKSSKYFQTDIFKLKKKIFEYKYPDKILEMVFPKLPKGWGKEYVIKGE